MVSSSACAAPARPTWPAATDTAAVSALPATFEGAPEVHGHSVESWIAIRLTRPPERRRPAPAGHDVRRVLADVRACYTDLEAWSPRSLISPRPCTSCAAPLSATAGIYAANPPRCGPASARGGWDFLRWLTEATSCSWAFKERVLGTSALRPGGPPGSALGICVRPRARAASAFRRHPGPSSLPRPCVHHEG